MAIENNFVPVLPAILVDPVLKLRLEQGRWNPESSARGGSMEIHLSYDPELRADRLTMPVPEKRRKLLEIMGPLKRDWTVFESDSSRQIARILVEVHDWDDEVRLEFLQPAESLEVTASLLARAIDGHIDASPSELLLYMFQSSVLMEDWDERCALPWGKKSVSFCTTWEIADALGAEAERTRDGLAAIASRAVRS